jgi:hypothetical protein
MDVAAESQGRTFHLIFELADVRGLGPKFQQDRHGDASNRRKMRGDVEIEFLVNRAREATRTIYARAKDEQHLCFDALYNIVVFCFVVCGKYFVVALPERQLQPFIYVSAVSTRLPTTQCVLSPSTFDKAFYLFFIVVLSQK